MNKRDSENEKGCEDKNEDSKLLKKININSDEIIKQRHGEVNDRQNS